MTNHHFNILIVEDEAIVAADLSARLTHSGFHVIGIADNYNEAIALFNEHKPDLILLDISIKGNKTGIDIATTINQILPTPFIFITAHVDADSIDKAKNTFPAAFLVKPFTTSHLLISVELAIHNFAYQKKGIETENKLADNEKDDFYPKQEYLFIKEGYKFIKIHQQDVLFLEAQDNYVKICTT
ncbi:MAG: response regulator, partial [Chitinophagaceae bacterium]